MKNLKNILKTIMDLRKGESEYHIHSRYRLDFIYENTFNRVWSVRMTRTKVVLGAIAVVASIAALITMIFMFTPVGQLLPGKIRGDLRAQYIDTSLKVDSLEKTAKLYDAYAQNIIDIISGSLEPEKPKVETDSLGNLILPTDSLMKAGDAEKQFVQQYEQDNRFNLSVLSPIAAEGMSFSVPVTVVNPDDVITREGEQSVNITVKKLTPVSAIYRGTVINVYRSSDDMYTIVVQHPNDFISVYDGLTSVFVKKGYKVQSGERLAHAGERGEATLRFELWHNGAELNPTEYMTFNK
jgi:murein DD-endopeptidase MepM/ murein hydrolase activator NlpD